VSGARRSGPPRPEEGGYHDPPAALPVTSRPTQTSASSAPLKGHHPAGVLGNWKCCCRCLPPSCTGGLVAVDVAFVHNPADVAGHFLSTSSILWERTRQVRESGIARHPLSGLSGLSRRPCGGAGRGGTGHTGGLAAQGVPRSPSALRSAAHLRGRHAQVRWPLGPLPPRVRQLLDLHMPTPLDGTSGALLPCFFSQPWNARRDGAVVQ
jgi:hypothetical protein